jgi:hypothetical protein
LTRAHLHSCDMAGTTLAIMPGCLQWLPHTAAHVAGQLRSVVAGSCRRFARRRQIRSTTVPANATALCDRRHENQRRLGPRSRESGAVQLEY